MLSPSKLISYKRPQESWVQVGVLIGKGLLTPQCSLCWRCETRQGIATCPLGKGGRHRSGLLHPLGRGCPSQPACNAF